MAAHCERHIVQNTTQQLFQPCVAWRVNGSACQTPVFDVLHSLALCPAHSHLRRGLEQRNDKQKVVPQAAVCKAVITPAVSAPVAGIVAAAVIVNGVKPAAKRKRKTNPNANPVGRPLKRAKKQPEPIVPATLTTLPPMTAVLQRKSSTTSLESIASNSQSSAKSHSQSTPVLNMPQMQSIVPPALAPLSDYHQAEQIHPQHQQPQQQQLPAQQQHMDSNVNLLANANFKADEISQIVAQLAAATTELHHNNNNNNLHYNHNNNNNNMSYCSNNNSNSGSSSISCGFPSFNAAFGQVHGQGQLQGQLASTESLLSQHIFGICENSSAYASSEDTGLGGLSESELIGANDAGECLQVQSGFKQLTDRSLSHPLSPLPDDIALNGAHLLEEHDLENVFDTLPDDAFNELFQSGVYAKRTLGNKPYNNAVPKRSQAVEVIEKYATIFEWRRIWMSFESFGCLFAAGLGTVWVGLSLHYILLPSVIIVIIVLYNLCRVHLLQCNKPTARPWIAPWRLPIRT